MGAVTGAKRRVFFRVIPVAKQDELPDADTLRILILTDTHVPLLHLMRDLASAEVRRVIGNNTSNYRFRFRSASMRKTR